MKTRTGSVARYGGAWIARVTWSDPSVIDKKTGKPKRRWRKRKAQSKAQATAYRDEMLDELSRGVTGEQRRFGTLADIARSYLETIAVPPVWENDVRVSGMRDWQSVHAIVNNFIIPTLGARPLKSLSYGDIRQFRNSLLTAPRKRGGSIVVEVKGTRGIARVNRILAWLRAVLNYAVECRALARNPMRDGKSLVLPAAEKPRDRVLSIDEEKRLLHHAETTPDFFRLRDFVILALDTGARRGELLEIEFTDVDFAERWISLRASTTKTRRKRRVPLSARAYNIISARQRRYKTGRVFPDLSRRIVANDFPLLCAAVKVRGFRLHDLRRTLAVRLVQKGLSVPEIALITGHRITEQEARTLTRHYLAADDVTLRRATAMLDAIGGSVN